MKYKGYNFRKVKTLGYRMSNCDKYVDGTDIDSRYLVWVKISDCVEVGRASWLSSRSEYSLVSAQKCSKILPLTGHSLTNMAYGTTKLDHLNKIALTPIYLVLDGKCYQAISKSYEKYQKLTGVSLNEKFGWNYWIKSKWR